MKVLIGKDVDVIAPFPSGAFPQAATWMHCYKTLIFGDSGPQTNEEIEAFLADRARQPNIQTWGIVDKNNLTQSRQIEAPLVGIGFLEVLSPENGYFHIASNRRSWGEKIASPSLAQQAAELVIQEVWDVLPSLQRLSAATYASNKAARNLIRKVGFQKDGYFVAMGKTKGQPQDVIHFGLLRPTQLEG